MNAYHKFPYTNFHELNLDWLLQITKHLEEWCAQFDPDIIKNDIQDIINQMVEDGEFDQFFAEWITPISDDVASLEARVATLETTQTEQDTEIATIKSGLNALTLEYNTDKPNIFGQLDDLSGDLSDLETTVDGLQNDVTNLSTEYTTFSSVVTAELADHETRITALENVEPPTPSYLNRNMTYRGQVFSTLAELLQAVENGSTYVGDYWEGNIPSKYNEQPPATLTPAKIIVAKHYKNNGAFLIVHPNTVKEARGTQSVDPVVDYGTDTGIGQYIDTWCRQIIYNTFGNKLSLFTVAKSNGSTMTTFGALLSSCQYFGYPAFSPSTELGYNVNGELPFVRDYLKSSDNMMLMDNNVDYFAFAQTTTSYTEEGVLKYSNSLSTNFDIPFMVKYN